MLDARRHRRIQPARTPVSRGRLLVGLMVALIVVAAVATATLDRSAARSVALGGTADLRVVSSAGPIEVAPGSVAGVDVRSSWLVRGPQLTGGPPGSVELACPSRWPCRAAADVAVPRGSDLEVVAVDQTLVVGAVDARVQAVATGAGPVVVGPMTGTLRVDTEQGDVTAVGLAAAEVAVTTAEGAVHLMFRERPRRVDITAAAGPVTIELPPGPYAVTVEGTTSATIGVHRDEAAESRISIDGPGPVLISETT